MSTFEITQRVKLTINGFELPGKVVGVSLDATRDPKFSWVTIRFDLGWVGCYHSKNVIDNGGKEKTDETHN